MRGDLRARATWVLAVAAGCASVLVACEPAEGEPEELSCHLPFTGRALQGDWMLTGSGVRENCRSRRLEGSLRLHTPMPIEVEAAAQPTEGPSTGPEADSPADAFVDRIERADYVLSLGRGAPDAVELSGEVSGSCVSFSLIEALPERDRLEYRFEGFITGNSSARGTFQGRGPEECEVSGDFEVRVR